MSACRHATTGLLVALLALPASCTAAPPPSWASELVRTGVTDRRVRAAMQKVRRADFLPPGMKAFEFEDFPLPIGHGQTTSQPTLIARMIQDLKLKPGCRVLEVGTGSGYQTALLAELCDEVVSIEIVAPLAAEASRRLTALGYRNVTVKAGDGYLGWPQKAPFDAIIVSAGAPRVPLPLVEQLKPGARLVIPVGYPDDEWIHVVTRQADGGTVTEQTLPVGFVPLTGPHGAEPKRRR